MATFNVTFRDTRNLSGRLAELAREDLEDVVGACALDLADRLKPRTPVDSRSMVDSIRVEVRGGGATVGYTAAHAPHVEYGHRQEPGRYVPAIGKRLVKSYVPGQHFFRPVVVGYKGTFTKRMQDAVSEAMR